MFNHTFLFKFQCVVVVFTNNNTFVQINMLLFYFYFHSLWIPCRSRFYEFDSLLNTCSVGYRLHIFLSPKLTFINVHISGIAKTGLYWYAVFMHRFKELWVYCFAHVGLSDIIKLVRLITGECLDLQFSCSTNTFGFYLCFSHTFNYCTITVFQPQVLQNIIGYLATAAPRQHLFIKVYKLDSLIVLCKGMLPKCKDISKHSTSGKP